MVGIAVEEDDDADGDDDSKSDSIAEEALDGLFVGGRYDDVLDPHTFALLS